MFTHDFKAAGQLYAVEKHSYDIWKESQSQAYKDQEKLLSFEPCLGALMKWKEGEQLKAVIIYEQKNYRQSFENLSAQLKKGVWSFQEKPRNYELALISVAMGAYGFNFFLDQEAKKDEVLISIQEKDIYDVVVNWKDSIYLTRDLINFPVNHMGPIELAKEAQKLAEKFGATFKEISGETLKEEFPSVWFVGQSSPKTPRMVEIKWGQEDAKFSLTLVGKGVCFDTGGVNVKPSSSMRHMKKDMGGAANVLGLAHMIMAQSLNIRLRVILPMVENNISSSAYRPGDIVRSRSGKTIEVGHTDAEGRVILADALTWATEEETDLIIDMATLTGAARIALGAQIAPVMGYDEEQMQEIVKISQKEEDYVWQLPLFEPYRSFVCNSIAHVNNSAEGSGGLGGAITAALFLSEFVPKDQPWMHFDIFGWGSRKNGSKEGGEACAIRSIFQYIKEKSS